MDLFRSQPSLCSLFLSLLEEWGAETLDWSLLRDEIFVDRFLRRLLVHPQLEDTSVFQACSSLLQPSPGGLLAAPRLAAGGHFQEGELESYLWFTVSAEAGPWDPMTWPELLTLLEEVAFPRPPAERARFLCTLAARGWVPTALQARFDKRIWETAQLPLREKNHYFAWLAGESRWPELQPKASHQQPGRSDLLRTAAAGRRGFFRPTGKALARASG